MNKDIFEGKWKQIRSQSTVWWSLMVAYDLDKVEKSPVKFDKYVTMLRVKYGYTRQKATEELNKRLAEYEATQKE